MQFDPTRSDTVGAAFAGGGANPSGTPKLDEEPKWKDEFRQTLSEVLDKGFGAYAEEINEKRMEELREKILAAMGLSEDDLENMSPEQRAAVEKMVAQEIQARLAAEKSLDRKGQGKEAETQGTADGAADLANAVRSAPGGLGAGVLLMEMVDSTSAAATPEKDEKTG